MSSSHISKYSPKTQKRWKANPLIERIIQDEMAKLLNNVKKGGTAIQISPTTKKDPDPPEPESKPGYESDTDSGDPDEPFILFDMLLMKNLDS